MKLKQRSEHAMLVCNPFIVIGFGSNMTYKLNDLHLFNCYDHSVTTILTEVFLPPSVDVDICDVDSTH